VKAPQKVATQNLIKKMDMKKNNKSLMSFSHRNSNKNHMESKAMNYIGTLTIFPMIKFVFLKYQLTVRSIFKCYYTTTAISTYFMHVF